jgi:hypothetical protein
MVPNSASLDITGNQVTVSGWVRLPSGGVADDYPFLVKAPADNEERYMLGVDGGVNPERINHRVTTTSGYFRYDTGTLARGAWEYVVMVYAGSLGSDPPFGEHLPAADRQACQLRQVLQWQPG